MTAEQQRPTVDSILHKGRMSGFSFHNLVTKKIEDVGVQDKAQLPGFLADLVLRLPTTVAGWNRLDIAPRPGGDLYQGIVLSVFSRAARSSELTADFLENLGKEGDIVKERFTPELLEGLAVTALSAPDTEPAAVAHLVDWSDKRAEGFNSVILLSKSRLEDKTAEELYRLVDALREKGQDLLADILTTRARAKHEDEVFRRVVGDYT